MSEEGGVERRLCGRRVKDRYATEEAARRALQDVQDGRSKPKGRNVSKIERRTYLCPTCHGYHLTSQGTR